MLANSNLQVEFFARLKTYLPPHLSLVEELVDLLQISHDSVYRRIRGEKPIALEELKIISDHFRISLDALLCQKSNAVLFFRGEEEEKVSGFDEYLKGILKQMKYFNSFARRQMFYLCKDAPIFYFYLYPEIAAFKTFFWCRSVLNEPDLINDKFDLNKHGFEQYYLVGKEIVKEYNCINSVELWNYESFNSTINQIEFYRDAGIFSSRENLEAVVESLVKVFDYLQELARNGVKPSNISAEKKEVQFYINEIIIGSNTVLVHLDDQRMSIITYSVLKYLMTKDAQLCHDTFTSFNNLKNKSVLISQAGEKERARFFNTLRDKAHKLVS
jgi:hypothetical protein